MYENINKAIDELQRVMNKENIDPTKGLPEELFQFATTLIPCANVDLFVADDNQRLLLTWRNDNFYGKGWHIPGGCLRIKETLEDRIQKTAIKELGTMVSCDFDHFITREGILNYQRPWLKNQLVRSHNISMLFWCKLPEKYIIDNKNLNEYDAGFLKWFDKMPSKLLRAHDELYGDIIKDYFEGNLQSWVK